MKRVLFWVFGILIVLLGLVLAAVVASQPKENESAATDETASERLVGVSLSPKSFAATDYLAFFDKAADVGNTLSWAGPWADLAKPNNAALTVIKESKKRGVTPVIITGPADGEVFDGIFQQGFRDAVLNFVKGNDVPYLGIGNEINITYYDSSARYESLVSILNQLAKDVKDASPTTKVFTIFQLERLKGLHGGLFGGKNSTTDNDMALLKGIENFDMVAFTTYPCLIYKTPAEIPEEYYSDITNHTNLPVIFTEVGWFREGPATGWEATVQEQADFITRFQELTERFDPKLVIWPFLYKQDIAAPFEGLFLLTSNEETSPGYEAWKSYPKD